MHEWSGPPGDRPGCPHAACEAVSKRVQIDENFAGAGAVLRADDSFFFHDLHDARGTIITDAQPALKHRGAGPLRRFQYVQRLLIQLAIVTEIAVVAALFALLLFACRA